MNHPEPSSGLRDAMSAGAPGPWRQSRRSRRWLLWLALVLGLLVPLGAAAADDGPPDPRAGVWEGSLGGRPIRVCIEGQGPGRYFEHRDRLPIALSPSPGNGGDYSVHGAANTDDAFGAVTGTWRLGEPNGDTLTGDLRSLNNEPLAPIHLRRLAPPSAPPTDLGRTVAGECAGHPFTDGLWEPPRESVSEVFRFDDHRYRVHRVTSAYGTHPLRVARLELLGATPTATPGTAAKARCCKPRQDDGATLAPLNAALLATLPTRVEALRDDLWAARLRLLDDWGPGSALEEWSEVRLWNRHWLSVAEYCEVRRGGETLARRRSLRTWALATASPVDPRAWFVDPEEMARVQRGVGIRAHARAVLAGVRDDCLQRLERNEYWQLGLAPDGLVFATDFSDPRDDCGTEVVFPYLDLASLVSDEVRAALCTELGRVPNPSAGGCR